MLDRGWTLHDIDVSDIFYLFEVFGEESEDDEDHEPVTYADDVPWL